MDDQTAWALATAREIVECEGSALITCMQLLKIYEIEAESTLLTVAISEALLEAFSRGAASATVRDPSALGSD
jgi:hypothetical protein